MTRRFTGRHMLGILLAFFGTVIAVNMIMARYAIGTFGGIVVENSYVASEKFNDWLAQAEEQKALGWDALPTWRPDGRLAVAVSGAPTAVTVFATARHPLGRLPDRALGFDRLPNGAFLSREPLPEGRWIVRLKLSDGVHNWAAEEHL